MKIIKSETNKNYFVQWQADQFKKGLWRPVFKESKDVAKKFEDVKFAQKEIKSLMAYYKKVGNERKLKVISA